VVSSSGMAAAIEAYDFSANSVTVVGYGFMGKHYVQALRALGVGQIHVCSRSKEPLNQLDGITGVTTTAGGYHALSRQAHPGELGIVATTTADLVNAAEHLANLGFRKVLIEKPVSLWSAEIDRLAELLDSLGVEGSSAYNRLAYPSFCEVVGLTDTEGGITSCVYTFTEMIQPDWPNLYSTEVLARWGVANSLHPIGMAHGLIGLPSDWSGRRSGALPWHPSGAIFVGSGISDQDIPFSYQADWGSKGRWSVEVNTSEASYRLCPLEKLYRKTLALGEWEELPVTTFYPDLKVGIAEEVAAILSAEVRQFTPLISMKQTASLTAYGEQVFGYETP